MNKEKYKQKFGKAEVKETKKMKLVGTKIVVIAKSTKPSASTVTQMIKP